MDQHIFQQAREAYDDGDFRTSASLFLTAAGKTTIGSGEAFHLAGNSLMRIRRYQNAITVYDLALKDDTYRRRGAALFNLGQAHAAMGDYTEAARSYEAAIAEPGYETPYKAWQALAATLMDRGRIEQAAVAYRKAAIDTANPSPGKALVNLGLCFMALGRPSDAVEAYKAALGCESLTSRGKALSNLGQAYTSLGQYDDAVRAFEKAVQLHGLTLSPAALEAYETAKSANEPSHEVIEGWETGDLATISEAVSTSGWNTGELMSLGDGDPVEPAVTPQYAHADAAADALGFGDEQAVNQFFSRTEDEMRQRDREVRRGNRGSAKTRWIKAAISAAVLFIVLAVSLAVLLSIGFGWPTQQVTVDGMLDAYKAYDDASRPGKDAALAEVRHFWIAGEAESDVKKEVEKISGFSSARITDVEMGARESVAYVSVTREQGTKASYAILLDREGVGWKISGVLDEYEMDSSGR